MADRTRRGRQVLNLGMQAAYLRRRYPNGETSLRGRMLTWKGTVTPTGLSAAYEVLVVLEDGHDPLVYVVAPPFRYYENEPLPHVYPHNTLCLFLDNEWGPWTPLADSILPWAAEWLMFYEAWTVTGEWAGGGVHVGTASGTSGMRRVTRAGDRNRRDERLDRLKAGLRQAYGHTADLEYLLKNSRRCG